MLAPKAQTKDREAILAELFPDIDCGHRPFAMFVIVQIRTAKRFTASGLLELPAEVTDTDQDNCQVAKVVAIGPGAFKDRRTADDWPEGPWYKIGDFVRAPKYGGDRWAREVEVSVPEQTIGNIVRPGHKIRTKVEFAMFKEMDIRLAVDDPLTEKAYI